MKGSFANELELIALPTLPLLGRAPSRGPGRGAPRKRAGPVLWGCGQAGGRASSRPRLRSCGCPRGAGPCSRHVPLPRRWSAGPRHAGTWLQGSGSGVRELWAACCVCRGRQRDGKGGVKLWMF